MTAGVDSPLQFGNDEERDSRGVSYNSRGLLHKQKLLKKEPGQHDCGLFARMMLSPMISFTVSCSSLVATMRSKDRGSISEK